MQKANSLGKTDATKDWKQEEKGMTEDWMVYDITNSMDMNLPKLWETVEDRGAWQSVAHGLQRVRRNLATEQQNSSKECWKPFVNKYKTI